MRLQQPCMSAFGAKADIAVRELLQRYPAGYTMTAANNREGKMSDIVILLSRILMSAVFIVYGSMKFMDVTSILTTPAPNVSWIWSPRARQRRRG
jgi:hypothetical protein